jgi:hypothetical protein
MGRSLWREDGSVVYNCCWPSPAQLFSSPSPLGLATIFYCLRFEIYFSSPPTTRRATVEVFDPASIRGWISLSQSQSQSQSQSYVTTDDQSASLSWKKEPMWGLIPDLYYCQIVAALLMCGALSDERTGPSFARVKVSSNKSVVSMCNLHFTCYWMYVYTTNARPLSVQQLSSKLWTLFRL